MLNTADWPRREVDVLEDVHLDPHNVRLEGTGMQVEADLLEDLFKNENVLQLVIAITQIGFLRHDVPVCIMENGRCVVVEGNRRLAALKAIQNPALVPSFKARVEAAVRPIRAQRDTLRRIDVLIAPDRDAANQLIAALHTSTARRKWSPARQAAFFQAQVDAGKGYKELLDRYPLIDVKDFVLRARLVNRMKLAVQSDAELDDFTDSLEWKNAYSTLTRIFETKEFKSLTGFKLDTDGHLVLDLQPSEFDAVCKVIVGAIHNKEINTRSISKVSSPRFQKLVSEMRSALDEGKSVGGLTGEIGDDRTAPKGDDTIGKPAGGVASGGARGGESSGSKSGPRNGAGGRAKGSTSRGVSVLDTSQLMTPDSYPLAMKLLTQEISILNYKRLPNVTFIILRAFLERSIKSYADRVQETIAPSKGNFVQLADCLIWLEGYIKTRDKSLSQPIKKIQSGALIDFRTSNSAMNAVNHNHKFSISSQEVEDLWNALDPILRELHKA